MFERMRWTPIRVLALAAVLAVAVPVPTAAREADVPLALELVPARRKHRIVNPVELELTLHNDPHPFRSRVFEQSFRSAGMDQTKHS